jgi:serine/threonine protein kinase
MGVIKGVRLISSIKESFSSNPKAEKMHFHSDYKLGKQLGEGGFATVYGCVSKKSSDDEPCAVKVFDTHSPGVERKDFKLEVQIMRLIGTHPSCVQFHESFEDRRFCYLVMEKCSCNILDAFLGKASATELVLAQAFRSLLQAVAHLHSVGVVHRDIKPCNILLKDGQRGENLDVKICDMGLAAIMPRRMAKKRFSCIPSKNGLTEICGTTPYMAPEMLVRKKPYSESVDEWSCGVTMYVLLFGEFPYKTFRKDAELLKATIMEGKIRPSFKARADRVQPSEPACEVVAALMHRNVEARITAEDALEYPFLQFLLPTASPESPATAATAGTEQFLVETPSAKVTSPEEARGRSRLPSFHATLIEAKNVLQEHEECTPLDRRQNIEKALESLQLEHGQQWHRIGSRCSTAPSHTSSELQRLSARLSTHGGSRKSISAIHTDDLKFGVSVSLPGTPSTTDSDLL